MYGTKACDRKREICTILHPQAWYSIPWRDSPENHPSVVQLPGVVYTFELCAENLTVLEKNVEPFFVVLIFLGFLVFPGFSGVQGLEDDFVKICGAGTEMVAGELDSVLATTSRCIPSAQAKLACMCAQRFVHRVWAQLYVHPSLQATGCKNRARCSALDFWTSAWASRARQASWMKKLSGQGF